MDLPSAGQPPSPEIEFLYGLRRGTTRLGLESTQRLLQSLGHPEHGVPMVHIAGTNGKGSCTSLAASMLQAGGLRVGRFTSPHVLRVEERVCVDGIPIDPEGFAEYVRGMRPFVERAGASFFEAMTALASLYFRDQGVDVVVYEVGLGGRLDATNALPSSVSVVTSVAHDHEDLLGRGLQAVCREKLGIARPHVPLFAGFDRPDLVRLARAYCESLRTPLEFLQDPPGRVIDLEAATGTRFWLDHPKHTEPLRTPFLGSHQVRNVALAGLAVLSLRRRGLVTRDPDLQTGAANACLPGRFQVIAPTDGDPLLVLDVAHNPEALQTTLDLFGQVLPGAKPVVVLGLLRDKKLGSVSTSLKRMAQQLFLTAPDVERSWDLEHAAECFGAGSSDDPRIRVVPRVSDAVRQALECGGPVLVIGSHYLLGEAVQFLGPRHGMRPDALLHGVPDNHARTVV